MGYLDIHAHLLPAIDDGPEDLEQSLEMACEAVGAGISTLATTPHLHRDFPDVRVTELAERCRSLREALDQAHIPLKIVSGAEVSLNWALDAADEELLLATYGQRGTDVLIETPSTQVFPTGPLLGLLDATGYRITLAHPERSPHFQRDDTALQTLIGRGVLLQLNAESLVGSSDRSGPRRLARNLLLAGKAHVLASDGHRGSAWRPVTRLRDGVEAAAGLIGRARAEWMVSSVPASILRGEDIPPPPPLAPPPKRRRFFGLG